MAAAPFTLGAALFLVLQQPEAEQPNALSLVDVSSWHIVEVDGQKTPLTGDLFRDDRYAIDIYPGGFVGYGGCNRFSGTYVRTGDTVTIKPAGGTRSRCGQAIMALEQRLFEILRDPLQVRFPSSGVMILSGPRGRVQLKRSDE